MKKIKIALCAWLLSGSGMVSAQNVYDTYYPDTNAITATYPGTNSDPSFIGEYQLFMFSLTSWKNNMASYGYSVSYMVEPVSFPFLADCATSNCGDSNSAAVRNLKLPANFSSGNYTYRDPFNVNNQNVLMSEQMQLVSHAFTQGGNGGGRDTLPHTILRHTYYLHCGPSINDRVIDSITFLLDHTRGYMSEYPFKVNNGVGVASNYDVTVHPWIVYPSSDSFLLSPVQSSNSLQTLDYFPYPNTKHFPNTCSPFWYQIPDPNDITSMSSSPYTFTHPSPYSLVGIMLGNYGEASFAGAPNGNEQPGVGHTYYIDQSIDLTKINRRERIIYNPSKAYITSATPVVFPSGYTFMTVGGLYPTATQVSALDPYNMYGDLAKVPITGSALNLTDNPNTDVIDNRSYYYVTAGCTLRIESCVTIYDCEIIVDSGAVIEYDSTSVFGNYTIVMNPGSVHTNLYNDPSVACKYLCYEVSNYNARHVTISSNVTWDTTNLSAHFTGDSPWTSVTGNSISLVEGITIDSGATLTIGAGVDLLFGPLGKVVVKKGGTLRVIGDSSAHCSFGPACQMEWLGIEVWGNPTISQHNPYGQTPQGYLEMEYCTIRHAKTGVLLGDQSTVGKEGGVINADHCQFLDNYCDVRFLNYRNFQPQNSNVSLKNKSILNRSEFRTTEFFFDPALWLDGGVTPTAGVAHVELNGVNTQSMNSNTFSNDHPEDYAPHLRGIGVLGHDAGWMTYGYIPNSFYNLSDGIWMQSSGFAAGVILIAGATFENNIHGIVLEGTQFSAVYLNEFHVPQSPQFGYPTDNLEKGYDKPVGVYTIGAYDFRIEENEFNVGDTGTLLTPLPNCDDCSYDIVVHQSSYLDTNLILFGSGTVYKNQMHHAITGIQVQGLNGDNTSSIGLDLRCNEYDQNSYYDFILNGRAPAWSDPGIYSTIRDQGDCNPNALELRATNYYIGSCTSQMDNQVNINTYSNSFAYGDQSATMPACYNATANICLQNGANPCSSKIWMRPHVGGMAEHFSNASTETTRLMNELDSLVDCGDTEQALYDIDRYEGEVLHGKMISCSPWLSDEVLLTLLSNENREKLSEEQLVEILLSNGRVSSIVWSAIVNADPAFGDASMEALIAGQSQIGEREVKERELVTWKYEQDLAANEITAYTLANDSAQTAIEIFEDIATTIPLMQKLFMLQMHVRNFTNASSTLANIISAQGKETGWTILAAISIEQQSEGRSWLNASAAEISVADSIYQSAPEGELGARFISNMYSRTQVAREPFGLESGSRFGQFNPENSPTETATFMDVYPNPTSSNATVVVGGASIAEGSFVQMTNTLGQVVSVVLIQANTPIEIDLSQFPPGMLYLRLMSAGECLASEKLLIIK